MLVNSRRGCKVVRLKCRELIVLWRCLICNSKHSRINGRIGHRHPKPWEPWNGPNPSDEAAILSFLAAGAAAMSSSFFWGFMEVSLDMLFCHVLSWTKAHCVWKSDPLRHGIGRLPHNTQIPSNMNQIPLLVIVGDPIVSYHKNVGFSEFFSSFLLECHRTSHVAGPHNKTLRRSRRW